MTDMNAQQLTIGGLLTVAILTIVFAFLIRWRNSPTKNGNGRQSNGSNYTGPERRRLSAGEQTTEYWERFFNEASLRSSEKAVTTLVLPILKGIQVSCNQTQTAVVSLAESHRDIAQSQRDIADILKILKERDDRRTAVEIAEDAAAKVAAAGQQH